MTADERRRLGAALSGLTEAMLADTFGLDDEADRRASVERARLAPLTTVTEAELVDDLELVLTSATEYVLVASDEPRRRAAARAAVEHRERARRTGPATSKRVGNANGRADRARLLRGEGRSVAEIATILDCTPRTVERYFARDTTAKRPTRRRNVI